MMLFGYFKGMKYSTHADDFEEYRTFRNTISRDKIIEHIESLTPALACFERLIFLQEKDCERVNTLMVISDSHLIFCITTRIMTLASPMNMNRI